MSGDVGRASTLSGPLSPIELQVLRDVVPDAAQLLRTDETLPRGSHGQVGGGAGSTEKGAEQVHRQGTEILGQEPYW